MYEIEIANSQTVLEVDLDFLQEVAERTLAEEQVAVAEISIALVDNAEIHRLNRQYLEHDYETDVLSFLFDSSQAEEPADGLRGAGKSIEGEIIVSTEMAMQMAEQLGWTANGELVLYLVHGLLHLAGYDDLTPDERQLMRMREREILKLWNLVPPSVDEAGSRRQPGNAGAAS